MQTVFLRILVFHVEGMKNSRHVLKVVRTRIVKGGTVYNVQMEVSMSYGRETKGEQNILKPRWKNAGWVQNEQETRVQNIPRGMDLNG